MANEKDLLEELFQSVDIIVNAKLNSLQYDITELCKIEEVKGNGEYYVSNGSAKYIAYAQGNAIYTEGVSVYVVIPQGNYDNQKLIIGKYTSKDLSSEHWASPMEDFVNITGNIVNNANKIGLIANGAEKSKLIWSSNKTYTQYDRLCISADFSTDFIAMEDLVIEGSYGLILTGTKTSLVETEEDNPIEEFKESNFICIFDSADMTGNPYDFIAPFNQQKMFILNKTDKISNLSLYFYQGLTEDYKFDKTFRDINNNLIPEDEKENLFVENISVNFGYNFDEYNDETAVLYTLDSTIYKKDEVPQGEKPQRSMRLRWVHFDDNQQPHSITDINDDLLKNHYVEVHWYRYNLQSEIFEDELAGYFWKEILNNKNKFEYTTDLETNWKEENFKVIIRYDDKLIESEILEFTNPNGQIADKSMVQGLNILYPEDDEYKGKFYIYGDDQTATISTEKTMKLIADYITVESQTDYWEATDVICWKFPTTQTMIHKPEQNFEFFEEDGDVFLEANTAQTVVVNGVRFTADPKYHLVIRRINFGENGSTLESREQRYRINSNYVNTYGNNTIKCEVFKPSINSVEAEISFIFGLYGTNGTKYTLAVDWEEVDSSNRRHQRPPAITWDMQTGDFTKYWDFKVSILDASHKEIKPPAEIGWDVVLEWAQSKTEDGQSLSNAFSLTSGTNARLTTTTNTNRNILNFAQYQILKLSVQNFEYELTTFIPIAIRSSRMISGIEGPTTVYYDTTGYNPKYNNKYYEFIYQEKTINKTKANWAIKYSNTTEKTAQNENNAALQVAWSQLPQLDFKKEGSNIVNSYLRMPDTYLPPESGYEGVCVYGSTNDGLIWVQPLYITMDPYGSEFFNGWDGSMKIDATNNTILSSVIGAGKKNSDNTFSGVVLGEVSKVTDTTKETGILGFQKGIQSFSLLNDGTATFGTSSSGQIKIDGNTGVIKSAGYELNKSGTEINLTNATINTPRLWIDGKNSPYLKIADSKTAEKSYFEVGSSQVKMGDWTLDNNGKFIGINSNKYTLVSPPGATGSGDYVFAAGATSNSDWSTAPFRVTKEGKLYASSVEVEGDIKITSGSISIGDNFSVDNDGNLTANNAKISGEITATSGKIENCTIQDCTVGNLTIGGSSYDWNSVNVVSGISGVSLSTSSQNLVKDIGWTSERITYIDHSGNAAEVKSKTVLTGIMATAISANLVTGVTVNFNTRTLTVLGGASHSSSKAAGATTSPVNSNVSGGNWTCFIGGTQILMEDYTLKSIEDIKPGDIVMTYNENTKTFESGVVEKFKTRHIANEIIDLYLSDNTVISLTSGHPMLTTDGWKSLDYMISLFEHQIETEDLKVGQKLIGINGLATIEKIEKRKNPKGFDVYNITVPVNQTYIANGYVAHNAALKPD